MTQGLEFIPIWNKQKPLYCDFKGNTQRCSVILYDLFELACDSSCFFTDFDISFKNLTSSLGVFLLGFGENKHFGHQM